VRVCTISHAQPLEEQLSVFAAVEPHVRKVAFATAVAETSITINGAGYVVGSGLT
jgi:HrpA-like RNA helicase